MDIASGPSAAGGLDSRVQVQLGRLRGTLRLRLALRGLGWTLAALLAAAWISFAADYGLYRLTLQQLPLGLRIAINALCLAAVAAVAWRRLLRPLCHSYTDADLAALVERRHPQLEDRLISAIGFIFASGQAHGASTELVRKVIAEANEAAAKLRFASVLRTRPVWIATLSAAGVLGLTGALAWTAADLARPWAVRNLLLRDSSYPKQTLLQVAGGNSVRVMRGDPLTVTVTAEANTVAPDYVTFHMHFPSLGDSSEAVSPSPEERRSYVKLFPMVTEKFSFYVTGNDDRTPEVRVEVVEPPDLQELDLEVRSPVYTGVPPRKVRRGVATLDVPEDSGIVLTGVATKDLVDAQLFLDQQPAGACRIPDGGRRRIQGQLLLPAVKPFRPCLKLRVALRDTEGFENPKAASYNITLRQDQPPTAHMESVKMGGDVTSQAAIPLVVTARDDYGVAAVHLEWSVLSAPQKVQQELVRSYEPSPPEPEALTFSFDLRQVAARAENAAPPLQVGETLRLQAVATDTRPAASGGAQKALSNLLTFRIVTTEELLAKALESQRAMREQIGHTVEMQAEVRDRCRTALGQARQSTTLGLAFREVAAVQDTEQQIEDLLTGTAGQLEALLEQLRNNRAIAGEDELRLRASVIEPLNKTVREGVQPLVRRFEAAKSVSGSEGLTSEITALIALQDAVIHALEAIVNEMSKVENAQHVEANLRALIKLGDQIRDVMKPKKGPEAPKP